MKKVILTFGAATDPVALMSHLLSHRTEAVQLVLSKAAEQVEYDYGGHEVYRGIEHDDFLEDVSGWNEFKDLGDRLVPSNLPLAIKLLRHALSEGLIHRNGNVPDPAKPVGTPLPGWGEREISRQNGLFEYLGTHFIAPQVGVFEAKRLDVQSSVRAGHSLALDSLATDSFWRKFNGDERLVQTSPVLADALSTTTATLDYYKSLVAKSSPTAAFLKNYESALEKAEYRKSVLLWFPEAAADALTSGAYSLVKMLYAIGRRNTPDPDATKDEDKNRPVI